MPSPESVLFRPKNLVHQAVWIGPGLSQSRCSLALNFCWEQSLPLAMECTVIIKPCYGCSQPRFRWGV